VTANLPQLWLARNGWPAPDPARFVAVRNPPGGFPKPAKGTCLWTSTLDAEDGWIDWCLTESPGWLEADFYLLYPSTAARVYEIDSYEDLERLVHRFPFADPFGSPYEHGLASLDWEAAAVEFDGIHLTARGQWATRLSHPLTLYGWDCESTCWLHFKFERWEHADVAAIIARARQRAAVLAES
jgi:hypothetical protein